MIIYSAKSPVSHSIESILLSVKPISKVSFEGVSTKTPKRSKPSTKIKLCAPYSESFSSV